MSSYHQELTVTWGESDPSGLVYYPREVAWFNEVEHELFRSMGFPIDKMILNDHRSFVMGEIKIRFVGPAAYGDRVRCEIALNDIRDRTVHWDYKASNLESGVAICKGNATRVYVELLEDGKLRSQQIPDDIREALMRIRPND